MADWEWIDTSDVEWEDTAHTEFIEEPWFFNKQLYRSFVQTGAISRHGQFWREVGAF